MEASLLNIDFEVALRAFQARRAAGRSRGVHLSDCVHRIVSQIDPKRFGGHGAIDPILVHGGFILEDLVSTIFGRQFGNKQIEVERDRVFGTLDGFSARRWRVIEMKWTRLSARNPIRSAAFMHWHLQVGGYCWMMDTLEAELIAMFANGEYEIAGRLGQPLLRSYLLRYSRRELHEGWQMILRARDEIEAES